MLRCRFPQKAGSFVPSFCSTLLEEDSKLSDEFEFDLKWTANSMYSGSADTVRASSLAVEMVLNSSFSQTITAVSHFFLAMIKHPETLAKAQKEIDSVVGSDRLPTFADRASLPYGLYFPHHTA